MHLPTLILTLLAAVTIDASPSREQSSSRQPQLRQQDVYSPLHKLPKPVYREHVAAENSTGNSTIALQCKKLGPQCMTFPPNGAANETISVRIYCTISTTRPPDAQDIKLGPVEMRPIVMYPCPLGARCVVNIDPRKKKNSASPPPVLGDGLPSWDGLDDVHIEGFSGLDGIAALYPTVMDEPGLSGSWYNFSCVVDD
ncbi:hypothetical protein GGS21DRAFT_212333 [Xylaria nigripes]|nr:hypothetical protein GGS21DRAFT_212333 [Xylaria nigripes]